MAVTITKRPPQYAAAFNPILLTLKTDDLDVTTLNLYVFADGGGIAPGGSVTLAREVNRNGEATFDLQSIAKRVFYNAQKTLASGLIEDYNLIGFINVSTVSEDDAKENPQATVTVINSVLQLNEWKDSGIDSVGLLYLGGIKRYEGFPLNLAAAALRNMGTFQMRLFRKGKMVKTYTLTDLVVLPDTDENIDMIYISDISGMYPMAGGSWSIRSGCTPLSPYYVRWINKFGGWNYEMFEKSSTETHVENYDNIQTVATNPNDTQRTAGMNVSERVTVNKGLLTQGNYNILLELARSPFIQWWHGKAWQTVVIAENITAVWNARNNFGDVSFTFLQPRILTQM